MLQSCENIFVSACSTMIFSLLVHQPSFQKWALLSATQRIILNTSTARLHQQHTAIIVIVVNFSSHGTIGTYISTANGLDPLEMQQHWKRHRQLHLFTSIAFHFAPIHGRVLHQQLHGNHLPQLSLQILYLCSVHQTLTPLHHLTRARGSMTPPGPDRSPMLRSLQSNQTNQRDITIKIDDQILRTEHHNQTNCNKYDDTVPTTKRYRIKHITSKTVENMGMSWEGLIQFSKGTQQRPTTWPWDAPSH